MNSSPTVIFVWTARDVVGLIALALMILSAVGYAVWLWVIEPLWRRWRKVKS